MKWILQYRTRLILNFIAWLFITSAIYNNSNNYHPQPGQQAAFTMHIVLFNLCFVLAVYGNTLWLIPSLLFKKKRLAYSLALPAFIFLVGVIMSHYSEWLQTRFPGSDSSHYSAITFGRRGNATWIDFYLSSSGAVFLLVFTFSIGFLAQKFFEVNKQKEAIQQQQTAIELSLLKSQINPHFLFNVLNSIYSLSLKKSDETPGIVLKLADILRYMLYETQNDYVPLQKEIQVLQDYLDIEKIRTLPRQNIQFVLQGNPEFYSIAPALLIPFVENTVKHGTSSMMSQAFIHIHILIENDTLSFNCKNNFKQQSRSETGGIGLENVRKRLRLLYPDTHSLDIKMEGGIFEVQLKIDLKK